jgi:glycosyltransferase involved in cell wall biosynthesis
VTAPRFTIVTPSFNQVAFVDETLRSVLAQTDVDLEYLVVDGGSTDGSRDVIRRHEDRLAYWCSEPDRGQPDALNKGFARASGEIFGFLNSDDLYVAGALKRVVSLYESLGRPRHFWACFPVEEFRGPELLFSFLQRASTDLRAWVTQRTTLYQPGVFWSRALFEEAGGFDASYQLAFDRKLFMELLARGHRFHVMPGPAVARFRRHASSKSEEFAVTDWRGSAFCREFDRLSEEFMPRLSHAARRDARRVLSQDLLSEATAGLDSRAAADVICGLAAVASRYPGVLRGRFFWGAARRVLARRLRTT